MPEPALEAKLNKSPVSDPDATGQPKAMYKGQPASSKYHGVSHHRDGWQSQITVADANGVSKVRGRRGWEARTRGAAGGTLAAVVLWGSIQVSASRGSQHVTAALRQA